MTYLMVLRRRTYELGRLVRLAMPLLAQMPVAFPALADHWMMDYHEVFSWSS